MDIIALLGVLSQCLDRTTLRRLGVIVSGMLSMNGRVTMLGISRWTDGAGSYRTVQRFYNTLIRWELVQWLFFRAHLHKAEQEYILVGDESVVTKSGKQTYGLDRFFSSIFGKPVRGLSFFVLSVVGVEERKSYPLAVEQVVENKAEKLERKVKKERKARGRPKGRKNKDKSKIAWTPELRRVKQMAEPLLKRVDSHCTLRYFVLDGHFGNNNVMQMVRQTLELHLISKLRNDSALYFLYEGAQKSQGPKRRYGSKVDYQNIPQRYLASTAIEHEVQTQIYQAPMLHKSFDGKINVAIVVKTHLKTGKRAHVVLFSSDLDLGYERLVDFYRLRFQIEFNFRDAKQFWGFEDFMNVNEAPVTNAVSLAFFMVNLSALLLQHFRQQIPLFGILDLKAHFHSRRFAAEALKLLPDSADMILLQQILEHLPALGAIHSHSCAPAAA